MKKYYKIVILIVLYIVPCTYSYGLSYKRQVLNLYIWGNYLPNEIINKFTKETKIKVNIAEYDNNETMYSKLKAIRKSGYDIVVPSSYYVERMAKQEMLMSLDKKKLTNLCNIEPSLLNHPFDPNNTYSVPYLWGSTGIIINTKYINKKDVVGWKNFWNKKYKDQLMILNDMRDVFSMALITIGYSVNDQNPKHIKQAYIKLKELLPNIKVFNIDTVPNIYIDEDVTIGIAWSGDYKIASEENPYLSYIYPKEGFSTWLESFVILKNAPNPENAHKFINFILRPEIAKLIPLALGHSSANKEAIKLLPTKFQRTFIDNPIAKIIHKGEMQRDIDPNIIKLYERYWEKLKMGE